MVFGGTNKRQVQAGYFKNINNGCITVQKIAFPNSFVNESNSLPQIIKLFLAETLNYGLLYYFGHN